MVGTALASIGATGGITGRLRPVIRRNLSGSYAHGLALFDVSRDSVVSRLASVLNDLRPPHPLRVGIDGRSAAGKTTLADELADTLRANGREVARASIDDFHRPGHKFRSMRGEWTPESYYECGYDYAAFKEYVLTPLGPGGSRRVRTRLFDAYADCWYPEEWTDVSPNTIAIVDGAFLLRAELESCWEYVISLDIDFETMVQRACNRDVAWVGSVEEVEQRYRERWMPTHLAYETATGAPGRADAVIDNRDISAPLLIRMR